MPKPRGPGMARLQRPKWLISVGPSWTHPANPHPARSLTPGAGQRPWRGFSRSKHASHSSMWCYFPLIQIHNVCSSLKKFKYISHVSPSLSSWKRTVRSRSGLRDVPLTALLAPHVGGMVVVAWQECRARGLAPHHSAHSPLTGTAP